MPGVKKHHQESENSGKPEYIYGHELGMIGVLTDGKVMQCVPVDVEIHDGSDDVNKLSNPEIIKTTSAEKLMQMVLDLYRYLIIRQTYGARKITMIFVQDGFNFNVVSRFGCNGVYRVKILLNAV